MNIVKKYSLIKKILIPILALAIFLLPLSPIFNLKKDGQLALKTNLALAGDAQISSITANGISDTFANFKATLINIDFRNSSLDLYVNDTAPIVNGDSISYPGTSVYVKKSINIINAASQVVDITIPANKLTAKTSYWLVLSVINLGMTTSFEAVQQFTTSTTAISNDGKLVGDKINVNVAGYNLLTGTDVKITQGDTSSSYDLSCSLIGFPANLIGSGPTYMQGVIGCVAGLFYTVWEVSAMIGHLAGTFLDFLVYYSTNSDSYKNGFISEGWKAIRDVANIFFIVALLYIAIKTILSLNVTNNKKIIGAIIIVALLINFSLFFTQVIIDGSNILAKIFYNNIDQKYADKNPAVGAEGEKSISVGLVDKFDPQTIIMEAEYLNNQGSFIFITLLAIAITLYAAYIFFTVGLLFVSRVVMLWLSMIFAPIAFASYTLPFDIPGLGHKEWWGELLKNAFLAPIFIFMLYIVVVFAGFLKKIALYNGNVDLFQNLMTKVIPFVILAVLLMKAKDIAVKYSGEMGKAIQKTGALVGGLAVGAATGGAAILGKATLGRAGSAIANSEIAKKWEREGRFGARTLRTISGAAGKGSFDVRGAKIGGKSLSDTGLKVGKAKEGGFDKMRADKTEKRQKRAKELEAGPDSQLVKNVRAVEVDHQNLVGKYAGEIERLDNTIKKKQEAMTAAGTAARVKYTTAAEDPGGLKKMAADKDFREATEAWQSAKTNKDKMKKGEEWNDADGNKQGPAISARGFTMDKLENEELPKVKNALNLHNFEGRQKYAKTLESNWNVFANRVTSLGQHSHAGLEEAAHKIRMDIKLDSGTKT